MTRLTIENEFDNDRMLSMNDGHVEPKASFSLQTLLNVYQLLKWAPAPFFPDVFIASMIPIVIIIYMVGGYFLILAPGNLYNALVSEDWDMFSTVMLRYILIATAVLILKVTRGILRESCANQLRNRLTRRLHDMYLTDHEEARPPQYYKLITDAKIDNPDQRVVADTRQFASTFFNVLAGGSAQGEDTGGAIEATFSILFYTRATYVRTAWFGIAAAYLWSAVVALLTVYVVNRTSPTLFTQERLEGDFRYAHAHFRRHVEQIAFLKGTHFERNSLNNRLRRAVTNTWAVIVRHAALNGVQYGFGYYISIVMYITLMVAVRARVFDEGLGYPTTGTAGEKAQWVSQTGGVFIQLLYSFTMLVQLGTPLSTLVANVARLTTLMDSLCQPQTSPSSDEDGQPLLTAPEMVHVTAGGDRLVVDALTPHTDNGLQTTPVTFTLRKGDDIVLTGPAGIGKTTILRMLRSLRPATNGSIRVPEDIAFVPQTPYIPFGRHTLRDLIAYPRGCENTVLETCTMTAALEAVGWPQVTGRLDCVLAWDLCLSPGEKQLLAIVRVLVAPPVFAVLDEPTAALDDAAEQRVISALKEAGISTLIVAHSHTLLSQGRHVITIASNE